MVVVRRVIYRRGTHSAHAKLTQDYHSRKRKARPTYDLAGRHTLVAGLLPHPPLSHLNLQMYSNSHLIPFQQPTILTPSSFQSISSTETSLYPRLHLPAPLRILYWKIKTGTNRACSRRNLSNANANANANAKMLAIYGGGHEINGLHRSRFSIIFSVTWWVEGLRWLTNIYHSSFLTGGEGLAWGVWERGSGGWLVVYGGDVGGAMEISWLCGGWIEIWWEGKEGGEERWVWWLIEWLSTMIYSVRVGYAIHATLCYAILRYLGVLLGW